MAAKKCGGQAKAGVATSHLFSLRSRSLDIFFSPPVEDCIALRVGNNIDGGGSTSAQSGMGLIELRWR